MMHGKLCFEKLIKDYNFNTILDVGCGHGIHTHSFYKFGKKVTSIDLLGCGWKCNDNLKYVQGNYIDSVLLEEFDVVWACHILEHQLNINLFLKRLRKDLKYGGVLALTVPPLKHNIVGGHVSLWNGGLLLYNLILAGFDCSKAKVLKYGYNISVIVNKVDDIDLFGLKFDNGDIEILSKYFPMQVVHNFYGDVVNINWS